MDFGDFVLVSVFVSVLVSVAVSAGAADSSVVLPHAASDITIAADMATDMNLFNFFITYSSIPFRICALTHKRFNAFNKQIINTNKN